MLEKDLERIFSFSSFRPGQKEIVESILAGNDTLALMPTGAGKSLCFQFPALMLPGLTVVISPLISLMKNQVDSLMARKIRATFLNSSISTGERGKRTDDVKSGTYKILYISPELLSNPQFLQWFTTLPITFIAIDEAHCISTWGHDFRPEYQQIAANIKLLPKRPIVAAFTATATQLVSHDIQKRLEMQSSAVFVRGFDRPNLRLFVRTDISLRERRNEVLRLVQSIQGSGIVYTLTIKEAEEIATFLRNNDISVAVYHGGLDSLARTKIQDEFMENQYNVVVATVAFGMGIDKADIRYVIHDGMPPNLERYYQEAGRAGRDDDISYCIILYNGRDLGTHHYFVRQSTGQMEAQGKDQAEIRHLINVKYRQLDAMQNYITTTGCRRKVILEYFNDPHAKTMDKCMACDRCLSFKWETIPKVRKIGHAQWPTSRSDLSSTVLETARLYESKHTAHEIAKIRGLGYTTILSHLAQWYSSGGNLDVSQFVPGPVEKQIQAALNRLGPTKLGPLKNALPAFISYEQIKFVIAKSVRSSGKKTHDTH